MHYALPKWPQCLVYGEPVTIEQAKQIILKTDHTMTRSAFTLLNSTCGNEKYALSFLRKTGYSLLRRLQQKQDAVENYHKSLKEPLPVDAPSFGDMIAMINSVHADLSMLELQYLSTDWFYSYYIGGPHGWCHPDGFIGSNHNIGKWPSHEEVLEEWWDIARAFPYLDLTCTLMSGEGCEENTEPIVSYFVKDGAVTVGPGTIEIHEKAFDEGKFKRLCDPDVRDDIDYDRHCGLPDEWLMDYNRMIRPVVKRHVREFISRYSKYLTEDEPNGS